MRRILLTNDDGIHAEGISVARALLSKLGRVTVIAPDREMSGASHSLTLNHPLRVVTVDESTYVVNGTPTDCVNLALNRLLRDPPDLVFSGINRGSNLGYDVTYSGTVAAALEGALCGVPSIAVSIVAAGDLRRPEVERVVSEVVERLLEAGRGSRLLNVNFPAGEVRGVRATVQGRGGYRSEIVEKVDPRGNRYYWIGGTHAHQEETRRESDIVAVQNGFVSVTPISLDLTDLGGVAELRRWWPEPEAGSVEQR